MTFLLDATVRISIIVLIALAGTVALKRRSAAVRHWLLAVAIACGAAMPILQVMLPSWHIGLGTFSSGAPIPQDTPNVVTTVQVRAALPAEGERTRLAPVATQSSSLPTAGAVMIWLWVAGAVFSVSALAIGLARLSRMASAARRLDRGPWLAIAADICRSIGPRRGVTLLQSNHPSLLVTWGVARPRIILPAGAADWPLDRVRVVLHHELAHVRRGDWTAQMLAESLRAVFWFNPLLWIACRRLRDESERACDDAVLNGGVAPADYASHLVDLARSFSAMRRASTPALAMARPSTLEGRVSAMLNSRLNRRPLTHATRMATLAALVALTIPIAVAAQNRFSTLSGTVTDQTNGYLPDTKLALANKSTSARYEVRTDHAGHFEFVGLPPGDYQLEIKQIGFATYTDTVTMSGVDVNRNIQLQVGSLQETIRITAGPGPRREPEPASKTEERRRKVQEMRERAVARCSSGTSTEPIGGNIMAPMKLVDVRPTYPDALQAAGIGGVVTMDALIGTDGTVRDVTPISSPHPDLERAAIDAVRQWEFSTTYLNCTPIEVKMNVTVNFVAQQ
jgi:TonB family protein